MASKLPSNLVKRPAFDSPFRRTTPSLSVVEHEEAASDASLDAMRDHSTPVQDDVVDEPAADESAAESTLESAVPAGPKPKARSMKRRSAAGPAEGTAGETYPHRMTVRFSVETWTMLQRERFERALAGERNVSAAEIAREVLDAWAARARKR